MTTQTANSGVPWQRRHELGFARAIWQTIVQVLLKPGEFFSHLEVKPSYGEAFIYYLLVSFSSGVLALLASLPFDKQLKLPQVLVAFIVLPIALSLGIFVASAMLHLFVLLFRGEGGYKATFDILAYNASSSIFGIIPFAGNFIGMAWGLVVGVIGFKRLHRMSTGRAVCAYAGIPIVVAVVALLAAIAIPNLLRARVARNEVEAKDSVMLITNAIEKYVKEKGSYPKDEYDLRLSTPPYLTKPYNEQILDGYRYSLNLGEDNYRVLASPEKCGFTGNKVFIKDNTSGLTEKDCR